MGGGGSQMHLELNLLVPLGNSTMDVMKPEKKK